MASTDPSKLLATRMSPRQAIASGQGGYGNFGVVNPFKAGSPITGQKAK